VLVNLGERRGSCPGAGVPRSILPYRAGAVPATDHGVFAYAPPSWSVDDATGELVGAAMTCRAVAAGRWVLGERWVGDYGPV